MAGLVNDRRNDYQITLVEEEVAEGIKKRVANCSVTTFEVQKIGQGDAGEFCTLLRSVRELTLSKTSTSLGRLPAKICRRGSLPREFADAVTIWKR